MATRKNAPRDVREKIVNCLKRPNGYRIYDNGQRYLDRKGLNAVKVVEDLVQQFETYELFELPQQRPGDRQKYQYVIPYDDPKLLIHVKITPQDREPPVVYLGFHTHNIPHEPLPQIPIEKKS